MALHRASFGLLRLQCNRVLTSRSIFSSCILKCPDSSETHTGQAFDKHDYRAVRYIDRVKEVNTKFAIDLVHEEPPIEIDGRFVWCDGGGGALGHPKVYINLPQQIKSSYEMAYPTVLSVALLNGAFATQNMAALLLQFFTTTLQYIQDADGVQTCGYCGRRFVRKRH